MKTLRHHNKSGIYKITAVHSGEFYIGSSSNICARWNRHVCDFRKNEHSNKHLQNIWNKYGEGCFVFDLVEYVEKDVLVSAEQKYIDELKPALNIRTIAELNLGLKHSDEAKAKMAMAKIGKKASAETRAKLSAIRTGKPIKKQSEESKLANAKRQAKFTDEEIRQIKWLAWLGLSTKEIAKKFDVVHTTIYKIITNKKRAYSHVDFKVALPT